MNLNDILPSEGAKTAKKRVGRGIGSGLGKTSGRGHKGQKARSGGFHKINFEGGQMPIQRRLPKLGFKSLKSMKVDEVTLTEIENVRKDAIDLAVLKQAGLITNDITDVKIILSGAINRPVTIKGLRVTKGAQKAIEQAGGSVES